MTTLSIDQIGAHLAEAIAKLAPGEEIILIDGGTPVAKLVAVTPLSSPSTEKDSVDTEESVREYAQYT